ASRFTGSRSHFPAGGRECGRPGAAILSRYRRRNRPADAVDGHPTPYITRRRPVSRRFPTQFIRAGPMLTVLIVIHLMVVAAMIGVVLLQKSEGGGLGIGSTGGFLSSRGTANVLTRTTAFLAITFFVTSLALSILAGMDRKPRSIL